MATKITTKTTKKRINLEVSQETYDKIAELAAANSVTMTEIIREGITLRDFAHEQKELGFQLAVINKENEIEAKIIAL